MKSNHDVIFKICCYPKNNSNAMFDMYNKKNSEMEMMKLLSQYVLNRSTPHIVMPISFEISDINNFILFDDYLALVESSEIKNNKYIELVKKYNENKISKHVLVFIMEKCQGGDLHEYIKNNYHKMSSKIWRAIFFQILFTLAIIQHNHSSFRHNSLRSDNIFVQNKKVDPAINATRYRYRINNQKFLVPDIGIQIKIGDFGFSCIKNLISGSKMKSMWAYENNVTTMENKYYDMHYFFNTLLHNPLFAYAPQEIQEFVFRIVPEKYATGKNVHASGRILVNDVYTTPLDIIMTDVLFDEYRK